MWLICVEEKERPALSEKEDGSGNHVPAAAAAAAPGWNLPRHYRFKLSAAVDYSISSNKSGWELITEEISGLIMGTENSDKPVGGSVDGSTMAPMAAGAVGAGVSKICSVCGDKALGYNFNAMTCESCKAFFRRNALSTKGFTCPFSESCEITVITRRFCQKCRLDKCFAIGMKKEYIMSEEDKALKRKKIEQNRARKRMMNADGSIVGESGPGMLEQGDLPMKIKREGSESADCWSNSPS